MRLATLLTVGFFAAGCASAAGDGTVLPARSPAAAVPDSERAALIRGEIVTRPLEFDRGSAHYVGGVSRALLHVPQEEVLAALDDVSALRRMLPKTKRATLVTSSGASRKIELVQGNSIVEATYTVDLVPTAHPGELAFRLDPRRPHGIDDVYGYFRVDREDDTHSIVTVAAAVHLGSGLTELFFGRRVQDVILSAPFVMRDYFAGTEPVRAALVAQNERH